MRWLAACLLGIVATLGAGRPACADSLAFTILKGDEPIGHDVYAIVRDGDKTTVTVDTETRVKVMFLSFHYFHHRTEDWQDGALQKFVSRTDDDGSKHSVDAHRDGVGLVATADGASKTMQGDAIPFTLWKPDLMMRHPFFDIADFAPLKVVIEDKGPDHVTIGGKTLDSHRFHTSGDFDWDLWIGTDGGLLKAGFRRRGYPITFLRELSH